VRCIPKLSSSLSKTFSLAIGWKKLGQPVPELNFAEDEKSGNWQQIQ
jgi:hypothetical protein